MRKIPLTVSMPQPCQQPWENMTPDAEGRFCGSCQKSVVDFSTLSDSQIIALLSDTSQKHCGRFKKSQLDRLILPEQQVASLLPAAVLGVLLTAGLPATASAADNHQLHTAADTSVSRTITGKVTLEDGSLIPGVVVLIKGTKNGAVVDGSGHYQLNIPSASSNQKMTLVFSSIGFVNVEVPVGEKRMIDVTMKEADMRLSGEVVVVMPMNPWQRLKYKWRRLWHR